MRQRAKIIRAVDVLYGDVETIATSPQAEPVMLLEDGREVTAYFCDRFTPEGTEGWATLDTERNIWAFNADIIEQDTESILPPKRNDDSDQPET